MDTAAPAVAQAANAKSHEVSDMAMDTAPAAQLPAAAAIANQTAALVTIPGYGQVSRQALQWLLAMQPGTQNSTDQGYASAMEKALKRPNTVDFEQIMPSTPSPSQPVSAPTTPASSMAREPVPFPMAAAPPPAELPMAAEPRQAERLAAAAAATKPEENVAQAIWGYAYIPHIYIYIKALEG